MTSKEHQSKLDSFTKHAKANVDLDEDIKAIYLVVDSRDEDNWGLLYVTDSAEELDNHCEKCQNEPVLFFGFRYTKEYNMLIGEVGPTKFKNPNILGNFYIKQQLV